MSKGIKITKLELKIIGLFGLDILFWFIISSVFWEIGYIHHGEEWEQSVYYIVLYNLGSVILFLLSTVPFMFFISLVINKPIIKIIKGIKEIAEGKYNSKVELNNSSEFEQIAEAINTMALKICQAEKMKQNAEKERTLLFANIVHDLKTPITSIMGYSKALSDGMVEDENKKKDYMKVITEKAVRMNDLIDRLFEYVKLENTEYILHLKNTDIAELLRNSIANIYTEFEKKNMKLEIQIPEISVIKNIDNLETDRVFTNLLNNVLKHNHDGTNVLVSMSENGQVTIADDGDKIPENVKNQLFHPFVSGDDSRMSRNGSGLGLALSYKIMKKQNGFLSYEENFQNGRYIKAFIVNFEGKNSESEKKI